MHEWPPASSFQSIYSGPDDGPVYVHRRELPSHAAVTPNARPLAALASFLISSLSANVLMTMGPQDCSDCTMNTSGRSEPLTMTVRVVFSVLEGAAATVNDRVAVAVRIQMSRWPAFRGHSVNDDTG